MDAGSGFVFSVVEKYSLMPVDIVEVSFVPAGNAPTRRSHGPGRVPTRHPSGVVTRTERCTDATWGVVNYSMITLYDAANERVQLTPCTFEIEAPALAPQIELGQLSPNGKLLLAHLFSVGHPTHVVVFDEGRERQRYKGFHRSAWVDDSTLVLVGARLAIARIGQQPTVIPVEVDGQLGSVAVSPDGTRLAFLLDGGVWVVGIDGSNPRQLLPPNGYLYPAWSPDGQWVATLQKEPLGAYDGQLAGDPGLVGALMWSDTNLQQVTIVAVDGQGSDPWFGNVSMHMTESQMPQGPLSWF